MSVIENDFFRPIQIDGCQLWLDAADPNGNGTVPVNGASISTWTDKSGNGRTLTAVTAGTGSVTYSTYGNRSSILFNSTGANTAYMRVVSAVNLTNLAVFAVYLSQTARVNQNGLLAVPATAFEYSSTDGFGQFIDTNQDRFYGSGTPNNNMVVNAVTAGVEAIPLRMNSWVNTSAGFLSSWVNGNTGATNASGSPRTSTATGFGIGFDILGATGTPTNLICISQFSEFVVYNSVLSDLQRQQVEGYLAWKWGLQGSLPATHPYKTSPIAPLLNPLATPPTFLENDFFIPTQITGCCVWLDAYRVNGQSMPSDNSLVSSWVNLISGGSNFTQATSSRQPTFLQNGLVSGFPAIYFNSSNTAASIQYLLAGPGVQTTRDASFFYVSRYIDVGTGEQTQIDQRKDLAGVALRTLKASQYQLRDPATNLYSLNYTANTSPSIKSYRDTLNTSFGYFNGTQVTSSTGAYNQQVADNFGILLGCHYSAYDNNGTASITFSKVFISEVIVYNSYLDLNQMQQVEGYLAWKWGLQGSLAADHPYKNSPIPPLLNPSRLPARIVSSSWTPTQVSGLSLWLDATLVSTLTITENTNTVTQWRDRISNIPFGPTNGSSLSYLNSTVTLSGGTYLKNTSGTLNIGNTFTIFVIASNTTGTQGAIIYLSTLGGGFIGVYAEWPSPTNYRWTYRFPVSNGGGINLLVPAASGVIPLTMGTFYRAASGANFELGLGINGTLSTLGDTQSGPIGSAGQLVFGANDTEGRFLNGAIGEILIYLTELTASQRQQVEGYLAWKWKLQTNLPVNHPFRFWPPPP